MSMASALITIAAGTLSIVFLLATIRSLVSGPADLREGRRRGLGLRSFFFRDVPIAGPRSIGVIAHVTKDGAIVYRKLYSNAA